MPLSTNPVGNLPSSTKNKLSRNTSEPQLAREVTAFNNDNNPKLYNAENIMPESESSSHKLNHLIDIQGSEIKGGVSRDISNNRFR